MLQLVQSVLRASTLCVSRRLLREFPKIPREFWEYLDLLGTPEDSQTFSSRPAGPDQNRTTARGTFAEIEHVSLLILILRDTIVPRWCRRRRWFSRRYARADGAIYGTWRWRCRDPRQTQTDDAALGTRAATPRAATSGCPCPRRPRRPLARAYSGATRRDAARAVERKVRRRGRSCEGCTQQLFEHP